ncbi:TlpA family protein disulfide reductase [Nitratiruptor sp. SB155-2]|uniref:TlpA family protein disulfide reductase n=1 Tax=Nitratiruptor sp. (strain SB155-2) TaxID=387092 RepID=UPI000158736A|nr:TlpA disulfide reductase family protein [Nitratiruptor sp. SB155-2]BAF70738.1 thioredoxin family protein [Nitratiruptor sp. SB155-2]
MRKLFLMILSVCWLFAASQTPQAAFKDFTLTTVDNKKIHIRVKPEGIEVKEYPGKVIILDFFGKHCPPCRAEIPILGTLQSGKKEKLQIIGLHVQELLTVDDIKELRKMGINYPIVDYMANEENRNFVSFMAQLTHWQGSIPFMLFFDKNGTYNGYHLGMANEESLKKFIDKLYNPSKKGSSKK